MKTKATTMMSNIQSFISAFGCALKNVKNHAYVGTRLQWKTVIILLEIIVILQGNFEDMHINHVHNLRL